VANQKILRPQKPIGVDSLPLPDAWAQTVTDDLAHYWERKAVIDQFDPCIVDDEDELGQEWLPGYDITDDHE
jgi:hypothetical protein